jgi:hypothetical protein
LSIRHHAGATPAEIEAEIERRENEVFAGEDVAQELAELAATEKSEAARRRLRECEAELKEHRDQLRHLRARRDTLASASVLRRLEAVEQALKKKPLNVSETNRVLKQAVSKIVMDAKWGTITFYWHHADEPSYPIKFAWPRENRRAAE